MVVYCEIIVPFSFPLIRLDDQFTDTKYIVSIVGSVFTIKISESKQVYVTFELQDVYYYIKCILYC